MGKHERKFKKKVSESIDSELLYQTLRQQKTAGVQSVSIKKLSKFMQNQGRGQFSYEVFKGAYDSDPKLQELVKNFDKDKIEFKQDETDDVQDIAGQPGRPGADKVNQMAKNATDLG